MSGGSFVELCFKLCCCYYVVLEESLHVDRAKLLLHSDCWLYLSLSDWRESLADLEIVPVLSYVLKMILCIQYTVYICWLWKPWSKGFVILFLEMGCCDGCVGCQFFIQTSRYLESDVSFSTTSIITSTISHCFLARDCAKHLLGHLHFVHIFFVYICIVRSHWKNRCCCSSNFSIDETDAVLSYLMTLLSTAK